MSDWLKNQVQWHVAPLARAVRARITKKRIRFQNRGRSNFMNFRHADQVSSAKIRGDNNQLLADAPVRLGTISVTITGSRNTLHIHQGAHLDNLDVIFCGDDCQIIIGENTYISQATLLCAESETSIRIGGGCMLGYGIAIRTGDSHGIFDRKTRARLNPGKSVDIGRRVWLANGVLVLKGADIPEGCIVGANSTVTKPLTSPESLFVGAPAKLVRTDVAWSWYLDKFPETTPESAS